MSTPLDITMAWPIIRGLQEKAPPAFWLEAEGAQDASLAANGAPADDASAVTDKPPSGTADALLAIVVRAFPNGGNCLEAAVRAAIELGWAARHHLSEEHAHHG